jgi:hypothetical protein
MERQIDFKKTMNEIYIKLPAIPYDEGDISDIGNEIGIAVGFVIENIESIDNNNLFLFIFGLFIK